MTRDVKTVTTTEVVGPIRDLMLDGGVHGVPVVDDTGKVAGIVTSSDLVEEYAAELGVTSVMSDQVTAVGPDATIVEVARLMLDHKFHHVVVVEDDRVSGIVSSFDLLRALAGEVEARATVTTSPRRPARPGDQITIRGHTIGRKERHGTIVEARGDDGGPPYVVRWHDDPHEEPHDVLFFPGPDADVEPPADAD